MYWLFSFDSNWLFFSDSEWLKSPDSNNRAFTIYRYGLCSIYELSEVFIHRTYDAYDASSLYDKQ